MKTLAQPTDPPKQRPCGECGRAVEVLSGVILNAQAFHTTPCFGAALEKLLAPFRRAPRGNEDYVRNLKLEVQLGASVEPQVAHELGILTSEALALSPLGGRTSSAESPIINSPSPRPYRRSLSSTEFVCPKCRSGRWGTKVLEGVEFGICNGYSNEDLPRCSFEWLRSDDWTVFRDVDTHARFASFEAFELACRR
jgi:hypothetical protein